MCEAGLPRASLALRRLAKPAIGALLGGVDVKVPAVSVEARAIWYLGAPVRLLTCFLFGRSLHSRDWRGANMFAGVGKV